MSRHSVTLIRNGKKFHAIPAALLLWFALSAGWGWAACVVRAQNGRMIPEKRLGAATASYFPGGRHVTVQVAPLQVAGNMRDGIVLIPSFIVPGKKVLEPKLVDLQFIVDSPADAIAPILKAQIFSDRRELASGVPKLLTRGKPVNNSVTRILMYKITYGKFLQMLKGREVSIRLGDFEFNLTEQQLASMRDLQRIVAEGVSFP